MVKLKKFSTEDQKGLLLSMLLVLVALFALEWLFPSQERMQETPVQPIVVESNIPMPVVVEKTFEEPRVEQSKPTQLLPVRNNAVAGSINLMQGGINALELLTYKETIAQDSPNVMLLEPNAYTTALRWVSNDAVVPSESAEWTVSANELTPFEPVIATIENADMRIERKISLDNEYMLTMTDTVYNLKNQSINVSLNGQMNREMNQIPRPSSVHEGFVGVLNDKLQEENYTEALQDNFDMDSTGGWFGLTDKYWMTTFILDNNEKVRVSFKGTAPQDEESEENEPKKYALSFTTTAQTIPVGGQISKTTRLFAGAKELKLINHYQDALNIPRFDLAIDFGWFYFLTKPFLYFLYWLYGMVGNMGVAILIFATLLRLAMLRVATKSFESMAKIRKITPKLNELKERYGDDRMRLQQETMNLYKREKVNPASGCLPMFIQIPVFFALYKVLSVSILMRQAPFFGWIHDLSMPDPSSVFTAFGYLDWPIPSFLNLGVWPILMGLTMYIQQKLNPAPTNKEQASMMKWMPLIFTFMLGNFAAGLVIYWTWSNVLSIIQQRYIMKKVGA